MFVDSSTLNHGTVSSVGSFRFQFKNFIVLGFEQCQTAPITVLQYGFGVAHSYAPNVQLSSEFQIDLSRYEFC